MVEYFKLNKTFTQGTTYEMPADTFYVIKKIGTNASSDTRLVIDGVKTGPIVNRVAPTQKTESNLLGPLDLKDLYYVIPPKKTFEVEGPSGARIRAIGLIGKLAGGEVLPAQYAARFNEQGKNYMTYVTGTATLAEAGTNWAADTETEVYSLTPKTVEQYTFDNIFMAGVANAGTTITEGMIGLRFFLEGRPLDILTSEPGPKGIDIMATPNPPAAGGEEEVFTLEGNPIEVPGDYTLSIKAVNVSGSAIPADSTNDMTCTIYAVVRYSKTKK